MSPPPANVATPAAAPPPRGALSLRLAGVYNVVWGSAVVLFPVPTLRLLLPAERVEALDPVALSFWSCIGMIVGVYGLGYWWAARDPHRHWPIVLVGFLGKIFGPIGFVIGVVRGDVPATFGATIVTNDLIWWFPFASILIAARRAARREER